MGESGSVAHCWNRATEVLTPVCGATPNPSVRFMMFAFSLPAYHTRSVRQASGLSPTSRRLAAATHTSTQPLDPHRPPAAPANNKPPTQPQPTSQRPQPKSPNPWAEPQTTNYAASA